MSDIFDNHLEEIMRNRPDSVEILRRKMEDEFRRQGVFSINKIVVDGTCDERILKILKPGEYVFTNPMYDRFFLEGVTVCSVVGKMDVENRH